MAENTKITVDRSGDYVTLSIPQELRKSGVNIFSTTAGWVICLSTMLTGGTLISGLSFKEAMVAAMGGMMILAMIAAPLAAIGGRYGVSTTMITRHSFGKMGSNVFGVIVAILLGIGWFAVQAAFFGLTMSQLLPNTIFANPLIGSIVGGLFMTLSSLYGYKGIAVLSFVAVPLIALLSLFGGIAGIELSGGWNNLLASQPTGQPMTLFQGITIVVGNAVLGSIILSDLTRYSKGAASGAISASMGFLIGGVFCIASGAAMAAGSNVPGIGATPDLPKIMLSIGMGVGALLVLVLAQWTTNTANLYSASLGIGAFFPARQKTLVWIMGILGTSIAAMNIYEKFIPFLMFLGTALPPVAGVIMADYYIIHRFINKEEYKFGPGTIYSNVNVLSIACVFIGAFLASKTQFFTPAFTSIIYALVVYSVLAFIFNKMNINYKIGNYVEKETGL